MVVELTTVVLLLIAAFVIGIAALGLVSYKTRKTARSEVQDVIDHPGRQNYVRTAADNYQNVARVLHTIDDKKEVKTALSKLAQQYGPSGALSIDAFMDGYQFNGKKWVKKK